MTDAREPWTDDADEDVTVRLLRLAGARPAVPAHRAARVRADVRTHWRIVRRRVVLRRGLSASVLLASAAALVLMIGRFTLVDRGMAPPDEVVAVVEQIDGLPQRMADTSDGPARARLSPNDAIRTGEWIETDTRARVALRFADGTSVRLDVGSRARPLSSSVLELSAGAVYVDTGRERGRFEVRTVVATARDVGTQFEVRLLDRSVRLRVRTGVVELKDAARSLTGRAGTEITLTDTTAVSRPIGAHGSEWEWISRVSPLVDIEGMALSGFLERVAREHGWTLHYADRALAKEASGIILHGSVTGLPAREAVDVAIATSNLRYRLDNGELVVLRRSEER
jgi:ferric-dicitrate binding protein FerR (iron transport regulator)